MPLTKKYSPEPNRATMPPEDAAASFQALVAALDYPMYVVTTAAEGQRAGCLVGFATQCSIDPPRLTVCLSKRNHTQRVAARSEVVIVHFLGHENADIAALFGENTGDEVDKFDRCHWEPGPAGAPILTATPGWIAGRILDRFELGDHVGLLLEPHEGDAKAGFTQLGFQQVRHLSPGHEA